MILKYFRAYFAAFYQLPPNSRQIQTLDLSFDGTGADVYITSKEELCECLGNLTVGITMYNRLQTTFPAYCYLVKEILGLAPTRSRQTQTSELSFPGEEPQISQTSEFSFSGEEL
ncbi:hypothetical protein FQN51_006411 [Onygenales sp. PD_10]|nr:hypothetical protein FQN51_006411 [Onygenales sp. PD_10]